MGMAAGQARLLSITSRMSDNELRAQIINNNKMRLATQSSQVSEAYVTALNEAQMMFTNYDKDNNASYQKLTYNALTAYNPYNNQYIVTNASGNVLLSEVDAENYKNANGDVEKFLKSYGLEHTTTYFDNLAAHAVDNGIQYKTGIFDAEGNELLGVVTAPNATSAKDVAKYIQDLYEGNLTETYGTPEKKLHPGYMDAVSSEDYYNYTRLLNDYVLKKDKYIELISQIMSEKLESITTDNGKDLKSISADINNATSVNDMKNVFTNLENFVNKADDYVLKGSESYFDDLRDMITANKSDKAIVTYNSQDGYYLKPDGAGALVLYDGDVDEASKLYSFTKTSTGYSMKLYDDEGAECGTDTSSNGTFTFGYDSSSKTFDPAGNNSKLTIDTSYFNSVPANWTVTTESDNSLESMKTAANQIVESLRQSIYSVWDPSNKDFKPTNKESFGYTEYEEYKKAAKALSEQIFGPGVDVGEDNYANLDNIEECFNGNLSDYFTGDKKKDFTKIYDAYILDCIMNTYGEPKYAWIDTSNPQNIPDPYVEDTSYNVNGDAKAQWYQNLFERIQKGGYKVLLDGLASSNEWIEFAFESGIITMEQIDSNKNWQQLIYTNCSDITEQTNDAVIAKAEAEYRAAMNKIENKDKRYDLELKNIDTEHNSLQVEYDSIKTAIDKNIERTFKLYS